MRTLWILLLILFFNGLSFGQDEECECSKIVKRDENGFSTLKKGGTPFTGICFRYVPKMRRAPILSRHWYEDGVPVKMNIYYNSGKLYQSVPFIDGKANGLVDVLDEDGNVIRKKRYPVIKQN